MPCNESWIYWDQETEFPVKACWLSKTQEGQTEQIHPQTFNDPFFDSTGLIYMHWVPTGQTVNKEYYAETTIMLQLWGMWSTPSLPSLCYGVLAPDKGPIYGSNRTV